MISGKEKPTNYSRRFRWLTLFIILLFGGFSVGWFYLAGRLESRVKTAIADLNDKGIAAECANLSVRGFPFRLGLFCDRLGYGDEKREIFATVGSFRSAAQFYQPAKIVGEIDGPLRISVPDLPPLWINWDNLQASIRLARPVPERVSTVAESLSVMTDPDEGDPIFLFNAASAAVHLRPNGTDVDGALNFEELEVDPAAAGGRALPVMNGAADVSLKDSIPMMRFKRPDLRDRSLEIRSLDLSSGDGGVTVSGPVLITDDGLVDARLTIRIRNPQTVAALLSGVFPEAKRQIDTGFAGLAMLGNEPSLPLIISKGEVTLGFVKLGKIPPLE